MALLHLGLILFEGFQKGINVIWLFRLVGRPQGRYIITKCVRTFTQLRSGGWVSRADGYNVVRSLPRQFCPLSTSYPLSFKISI